MTTLRWVAIILALGTGISWLIMKRLGPRTRTVGLLLSGSIVAGTGPSLFVQSGSALGWAGTILSIGLSLAAITLLMRGPKPAS